MKTTLKFLAAFILMVSCSTLLPPAPDDRDLLDGPTEGLTAHQSAEFARGDELFGKIFSVETGLGPVFVQTSCAACHPGDGKAHPGNALFRALGDYGPQIQQRAIPGYTAEPMPAVVSKRVAPAISGLGFLQAVPDSTLLALADPADVDSDGISGAVSRIFENPFFSPDSLNNTDSSGRRIGRFGFKASSVTLLDQTVGAYIQDMGVSSEFHLEDNFNLDIGKTTGDKVADPEVPASDVNSVVFYLRTLKIPPRRNAETPQVKSGEALFNQIGCAACHVPTLKTGYSEIEALRNKTIHPYTDLLLHDMGPALDDGVPEGSANPYEWRTTPLWGIGLAEGAQGGKAFYLHDGSASTLEEAISKHGGEAVKSASSFRDSLSTQQQSDLIKFLESL